MKKLIQWGNSKLPNILMFNIPATKEICGRVCPGCYSHKAYKIYPNVLPAQEERYQASLQPDFVSKIRKEIGSIKKPFKYFRIHASAGEFYSQPYLDSWVRIIKSLPNVTFYAYTKRKRDFDFSVLESLPNCCIIDSLHFGRVNYTPKQDIPTYVPTTSICPHQKGSSVICGETCNFCMRKDGAATNGVWFVKH